MKLLFDENLSYRLVRLVASKYSGSEQVKRLGLLQGTDSAIWHYARQHGYCIVTQDEDFAEMSALRGAPPRVLLLRAGNYSTAELADLLLERASLITSELAADSETYCLTLYP